MLCFALCHILGCLPVVNETVDSIMVCLMYYAVLFPQIYIAAGACFNRKGELIKGDII